MPELSLELLGPFQASLDGRPLTKFGTNKAKALLIYLAVEDDPAAGWRPSLMELLWPGKPQQAAQQNLRQTIYLLRQALGGEAYVWSHPAILSADQQRVHLDPTLDCHLDCRLFSSLLIQSRHHAHPTLLTCQHCHDLLEQAVSLYRGDFLGDFFLPNNNPFEEWVTGRRETLQRHMLDALGCLAGICLQLGDLRRARDFARWAVRLDRLQERAYQQLMEALARDGRRNQALAAYEEYRSLLWRELGTVPLYQTMVLRDRIAAGELDVRTTASSEFIDQISRYSWRVAAHALQMALSLHQAESSQLTASAVEEASVYYCLMELDQQTQPADTAAVLGCANQVRAAIGLEPMTKQQVDATLLRLMIAGRVSRECVLASSEHWSIARLSTRHQDSQNSSQDLDK